MSSMIKLHRSEHANPSWKIIFLQVLLSNNQQFNCFQQKGMQKSAFNICNTKVLYTHMLFWEVDNYFSKLNFSFKGVYYIFKGYL